MLLSFNLGMYLNEAVRHYMTACVPNNGLEIDSNTAAMLLILLIVGFMLATGHPNTR
jgi:hypothetical protein